MVSEINIFIVVAASVTVLTVVLMIVARRFRGQRNGPPPLPTTRASGAATRQGRALQFRPSDRPVKPYNAFSEAELQLIEVVVLTHDDVKAMCAPKEMRDLGGEKPEQMDDHSVLRFASPECSICLTPFDSDEVVRVLVCGHTYHTECIDVWLTQRSSLCPICKTDIRKALGLEPRTSHRAVECVSSPPPALLL
ncbi:hypothetical protein GGI04_001280 [Coemansia thaxteri]|uniref:RING-type domain-containing protein n=1 Tax=Coemansia thaxteri TaxID=2663907 RepID=A0A9W8BHB4_9FUNG|nr:hypothetical protein H4R26_003851 [Coemansia thaxteri]KAJ2008054.1 hypothetical protein GGI04_001280 [Coemansia thaxteri]KAJ2472918.1 hypothetical protein GGI02_001243 [Coemansia sp. RSA 2322]KAJ2474854.1 hypothetical protein EV174_005487 [Coemansia sp. RSA 2320]